MTRILYRFLLALHPRAFRTRFGAGMLCTFDDARATTAASLLLLDAAVSLVRQWVVREAIWIYAAACAGAALTLYTGFHARTPVPLYVHAMREDSASAFVLVCAIASLLAISLTTILCVVWFRFTRNRRHA